MDRVRVSAVSENVLDTIADLLMDLKIPAEVGITGSGDFVIDFEGKMVNSGAFKFLEEAIAYPERHQEHIVQINDFSRRWGRSAFAKRYGCLYSLIDVLRFNFTEDDIWDTDNAKVIHMIDVAIEDVLGNVDFDYDMTLGEKYGYLYQLGRINDMDLIGRVHRRVNEYAHDKEVAVRNGDTAVFLKPRI